MEWIDAKEKVPAPVMCGGGVHVIIAIEGYGVKFTQEAVYKDFEFKTSCGDIDGENITHWMYWPKHPTK